MANGDVVTNNGRLLLMQRLFSANQTAVSQFAVGTGTTTPTNADTAMQTAVLSNIALTSGYPVFDAANNKATIRGFLSTTQANSNSLTEFGLNNTDGTNVLFDHHVHNAITKNNTTEVAYVVTITVS